MDELNSPGSVDFKTAFGFIKFWTKVKGLNYMCKTRLLSHTVVWFISCLSWLFREKISPYLKLLVLEFVQRDRTLKISRSTLYKGIEHWKYPARLCTSGFDIGNIPLNLYIGIWHWKNPAQLCTSGSDIGKIPLN